MQKIGKYFRELSIVVVGVAITLSFSYWIGNRSEKRDLALYLNALKLELEANIQIIDTEIEYLQDWENYARYLNSHDMQSLHPDSIRWRDYEGLGRVKNVVFQTGAFEMLKNSGTMRLIKDKDLLQAIWNAYLRLEKIRFDIDTYYELKSEYAKKENQLDLEGKVNTIPLYDFFTTYYKLGTSERCEELSTELKITVLKLND